MPGAFPILVYEMTDTNPLSEILAMDQTLLEVVLPALSQAERATLYRMIEDEVLDLFQHLVNTGMAWELQGSYGRTARSLIDAGLIGAGEETA